MDWLYRTVNLPDPEYYQNALVRQSQLTKPAGSLGRLEEMAARLAAMQKTDQPEVENVWITVFAADHGVADTGVSAFPQSVTMEMLKHLYLLHHDLQQIL
ncbi:MAG: nicotinate-nucleotide--dimethylbenzimidazole phosphoribosyltransferase [Methylococcales bacterium]|nr:nicotinate-nucleotide--dimethylbenzimidazole phosphoribosyltransferase [Methylococcales bacterium]